MPAVATHFFIAETLSDCRRILRWRQAHPTSCVDIFVLSLEAREFLSKEGVDFFYVWDLFPMNDMMMESYKRSQSMVIDWRENFSLASSPYLEESVMYELDVNIFYNSALSLQVLEKIDQYYSTKRKPEFVFLGFQPIFLSSFQKSGSAPLEANCLFKGMAYQFFSNNGFEVNNKFLYYWSLFFLVVKCYYAIFFRLVSDVLVGGLAWLLPDRLFRVARGKGAGYQVITSGWGRDLSRMISLTALRLAHDANDPSFLNLVWRPHKLADFRAGEGEKEGVFKNMVIKEEVKQGVAYGPRISLIGWSGLIEYIKFCWRDLYLERWRGSKHLTVCRAPSLGRLGNFNVVRLTLLFTCFFAYRSVFLSSYIIKRLAKQSGAKIFIGSDSGAPQSRGELLAARQIGLKTFSAPHSHYAYAQPPYYYLADYFFAYGPHSRELIVKSSPIDVGRVFCIGNRQQELMAADPKIFNANQNMKIVVGTRSRGGLWFNFSSQHNVLHEELENFLGFFSRAPGYQVTVKSHPNGDYACYYTGLVDKIGADNLRHEARGWKLEEFFAECDVLVCFGELTSFYLMALYRGIPVVYIKNVMSSVTQSLHYDYSGAGIVVEGGWAAAQAIQRLKTDSAYRESVLARQAEYCNFFSVSNAPESNLLRVVRSINL